jgi:hypothetical protein
MANFKRIASFVLAAVLIPALHTEPRRFGVTAGPMAQVDQTRLGGHSAVNLLANLSDLRVLRIGSQALAGVLGEDILVRLNVLIDNHNHELGQDGSNATGSRQRIAQ